jgi:hypothetical protein
VIAPRDETVSIGTAGNLVFGGGNFLSDTVPEEMAAELRAAGKFITSTLLETDVRTNCGIGRLGLQFR